MKPRERILTLLRGGLPDRLPFVIYDHHLRRGEKEREARNRGMGIYCYRPCYLESMPNVEIVTRNEENKLINTYNTPVGSVTEILVHGIGYGVAYGRGQDWKGVIPRRKEFLVKRPEDYEVLKFMVENIRYEPYNYAIDDQTRRLGDDGIVVTELPYEPLQRLLVEWVHWQRFYKDLASNRETIEEICEILEEKYEKELFPIAADSPCEIVAYGGNIDGVLVSPSMFEKYYLPSYARCAEIIHPKGKILANHMDGRLRVLAHLIGESKLDVIEAFTLPPMGDLPIDEALALWKNKIIFINFPAAISTLMGPNPQAVKRYLLEQLELMIPGDRLMLIASTENVVPEENIIAMTEVMEKTTLPLTRELVRRIRSDF